MSETTPNDTQLNILFSECAPHILSDAPPTDTPNLEIFVTLTPPDVQAAMEFRRFDIVMVRVDPGSRESLAQMVAVRDLAIEAGMPLVSLSTFNALWIENLFRQQGVNQHFRNFPTHSELSRTLIQFEELFHEKYKSSTQ
ncbi:hypothetical protein [Falsiphaeobacter marinintestinus]|uniref:hypothetical protein n=1 Tax=Falsiphaeobacter marinintestinus TaxID=1492905 RepID=UPI0011B847C1|nr:hypothetical protein [Phaeobacter marinintestinus]